MDTKEINILVIEDSPRDYAMYQEMLADAHTPKFNLQWAQTLAAGMGQLPDPRLDIILLDLFLPETRGLKTLTKLQKKEPGIAIVVLTQLDDEQMGMSAVREGAQEYLVKGQIDRYHLQRSIRHGMERHRIEGALRASEEQHRALAEKVQQANLELESFTYSVSHDLRAPLRAITGFAEIINRRHRATLSEDVQHYLDNIIQGGKQMGWLIDDLLAYSRLGRGSLTTDSIDLNDFFAGIKRSVAAKIKEHNATVTIATGMPTLEGNKSLLSQVFSNLIVNAMSFHKPDVPPTVTVSSEQKPGLLVFCVADNGIGIPPEVHENIFHVFQRAVSPEEYPGTGIGLAIVKKSVELLHGSVSLQSEVGVGSNFYISIPHTEVAPASAATAFWDAE